MSFLWPLALISLVLVPLLALLYVLLQRRRRRMQREYAGAGFGQMASSRRLGLLQHLPAALMLLGLAVLLTAAARPFTEVTLPRVDGTVVLAFDVSGSMAADDLQPTRMEAAKAAARAFVDQQPSTVRIGIVAFSDSGFSVQTPTDDKDAVMASINRLSPQRGTSVGNGILVSLKAIADSMDDSTRYYSNATPQPTPAGPAPAVRYDSAVVVLLSDGENNEKPDPLAAAQTAASHGVRIYTVGLGSPAGTTLHINGFTVHTQLDEQRLQQIAQITGGTYYNAVSTAQLASIYSNLHPQLIARPEQTEVTALFAAGSAILLLLGGLLSLLWFRHLP